MEVSRYLLANFLKLTVLNLTELSPREAGGIIKMSLKYCIIMKILILYCTRTILKMPFFS